MGFRQREFLLNLQRFTADAMISQSAVRNIGVGARAVATDYVGMLGLHGMGRLNRARYACWLDMRTDELAHRLGQNGAGRWGNARKVVNIFMRSAAYTQPLAEAFQLEKVLPYLEVPLDSYVARELRGQPEGEQLPRWDAIIRLTRDESRAYQEAATAIARRKGVHRADLDALYWQPAP